MTTKKRKKPRRRPAAPPKKTLVVFTRDKLEALRLEAEKQGIPLAELTKATAEKLVNAQP